MSVCSAARALPPPCADGLSDTRTCACFNNRNSGAAAGCSLGWEAAEVCLQSCLVHACPSAGPQHALAHTRSMHVDCLCIAPHLSTACLFCLVPCCIFFLNGLISKGQVQKTWL